MSRPIGTGKTEADRYVARQVKAHPALWERLDAAVARQERSEFIRKAVEEALLRKAAEEAVEYYRTDPDFRDWLDADLGPYSDSSEGETAGRGAVP